MNTQRRATLVRAATFVAFVILMLVLGLTIPLPDVQEIRENIQAAGAVGLLIFVVGYGLITLTPIPKSIISIAAGAIWGFGLGVGLVYIGALLGAALAFVLGRALGRDAVEQFTGARIERVDAVLRRRGLLTVIGLRLIPVLPFTVINYAAGLTSIRRRDYAVGTMIGIIPGTMAYVALGAFGITFGWQFDVAAGVLGLLSVVGAFVGIRARRQSRRAVSIAKPTDTPTHTTDSCPDV